MQDVIVVGAGPAGSYASYMLAKKGFIVTQLEEHREVGKPGRAPPHAVSTLDRGPSRREHWVS